MDNVDEILTRLKLVAKLKNDKDIAELFGIAPSDFSNRKKRGSLTPLLMEWCKQEGVSFDWLLSGGNVQVATGDGNVQVGNNSVSETQAGQRKNKAFEKMNSSATHPVIGELLKEICGLLRYAPVDYLIEIKEVLEKYRAVRNGK